jgi:hypothetical protein
MRSTPAFHASVSMMVAVVNRRAHPVTAIRLPPEVGAAIDKWASAQRPQIGASMSAAPLIAAGIADVRQPLLRGHLPTLRYFQAHAGDTVNRLSCALRKSKSTGLVMKNAALTIGMAPALRDLRQGAFSIRWLRNGSPSAGESTRTLRREC